MSPKKKKQAGAAQQLIDSLLDERTPTRSKSQSNSVLRLRDDDSSPDATISKITSAGTKSRSINHSNDAAPDDANEETRSVFAEDAIFVNATDDELVSDLELEQVKEQAKADKGHRSVPPPPPGGGQSAVSLPRDDEPTATFAPVDSDGDQRVEQDKTVRIDTSSGKRAIPMGGEQTLLDVSLPGASQSRYDERTNERTSDRTGTASPASSIDRNGLTELKTVVHMKDRSSGVPQNISPRQSSAQGSYSSPEAALRQSESLRIAQSRISELESELERLRRENEKLASAGETLGRRSDELASKLENSEIGRKETERIHDEERKVVRGQLQAKDREITELKSRLEEMEVRLEGNFKKIRVRERELEHRLEIVRMESATLVSTKDKMILDLKRQIDQLAQENDYGKQKTQELYNQYKDKQETARRVVRALRIALTILEGDEENGDKKSE